MKTRAEKIIERDIEIKIKRQIEGIHDQYSSLENIIQEEDYRMVLHADLEFTPKKEETFQSYATRASIYAKFNATKNIKTHISGPKGAWYTHRNPAGCFACEDMNLISVLIKTLHLMAKQHPNSTF